jgi:oligopeptidase B
MYTNINDTFINDNECKSSYKYEWKSLIPYDPELKIDSLKVFDKNVVLLGRKHGLTHVQILPLLTGVIPTDKLIGEVYSLTWPEAAYLVERENNREFKSNFIRLKYSSMVTPPSIYDFNFDTKLLTLQRQKKIPNYDKSLYETKQFFAMARDGVKIPMSLVYRKDKYKSSSDSGRNYCMLYGYGAYGSSEDPNFDENRLVLLDRGLVYVIAHIRGGGEMGQQWHEDGKMLNKKNTFNDFIDCALELINSGITSPSKLAIAGGSAGGLLMGAVVNMRPDLFRVVYTRVPFVDVLMTMSDPTIPLTVTEWEEWGNPQDEKYHNYMASYSPIDNIDHVFTSNDNVSTDNVLPNKSYPSILATTGLHDSRVPYWEPAKWIAKLRNASARMLAKTSSQPILLLKTKMNSGHGGSSGRYDYLRDKAFEISFVLNQLGINF